MVPSGSKLLLVDSNRREILLDEMHKSRHICTSMLSLRGVIYFCSNIFLSLIIHGWLFFPKVAVKIIDKTQLNPTSLQKVRIHQ